MLEDVVIEPMTEEFILWRCLHSGPLSSHTIEQWPSDTQISWEHYRQRNLPLLVKLTRVYGACAILARANHQVVGQLRFYPKAVRHMEGVGELCLQQDYPAGAPDDFDRQDFPPLAQIEDKTLLVHCLMTGCPQQKENPFQRKGVGSAMVRTLIQWAKTKGWKYIEANAFEDLPIIYGITGSTGHIFWEKLGFSVIYRYPHPYLQGQNQFVTTLEEQAKQLGIPPGKAKDQIVMRLNLT